jgi:oxygen-dependent protoporphyrinogen oxidase
LRSDELAGAYGVLMHPDEAPLAALCVASRAGHAVPGLDLVTCLFTDADARRLSALSDAEIIAAAKRSLLAWAPSLANALRDGEHRAFRIPAAMPKSERGRLATIDAYRTLAPGRRVVLAGDSLAWPWSDSAAFSGEWAADRVLELVAPD